MRKIVKILSIDGGGIRGIIPAIVLTEIERITNKPIAKLFDLIAGTSTGGMLGLALTKPDQDGKPYYSAQELISLYEVEGTTIFSNSVWYRIPAIGNLTEEKYKVQGLEHVLNEYLGETMLSEAMTNLLVSSYEIERRIPFFFKSVRAKEFVDYDFPMKIVARATSAAPTYFKPLKLHTQGLQEYYALVDGSVFANNPAMCAFVEAKSMFPDAEDFLMVSLGTGDVNFVQTYQDDKGWGLIQWAEPLLDIIVHGSDLSVNYQMSQLLTNTDGFKRYYRFQPKLSERHAEIDNTSKTNIRMLKLAAEAMIRERQKDLNALCKALTEQS
ncbi:Patatin [Chloroherpeton thalassium ATCC 35110]|uniref:Patatin n=1 Tax=Chloroherpeton thalassium (strain ATCC 35110 / GB-78) TaxID=517418 RepID=B3QWI3_CHLT3|nr:CBASS cGAMP-activated phospholipase [Chloroherpeton thalassium]ACF14743.1 Patatin [Chloroherpeton thalassium ATCC 35110]